MVLLPGVLISLALCWALSECQPPPGYDLVASLGELRVENQADVHTHPVPVRPRPSPTLGTEQWRDLVTAYFPTDQIDRALCIIGYESGGDPNAKNTQSTATGLFQFLHRTWDSVPTSVTGGSYASGAVYDPEANVRAAAWLWGKYDWTQWSPYNRGLCR